MIAAGALFHHPRQKHPLTKELPSCTRHRRNATRLHASQLRADEMRFQLVGIALLSISLLPFSNGVTFELQRLSIDQILEAVFNGTSCVEITQFFLSRILKHNPRINAVITVDESGSLEQAEKLDQHYRDHGRFVGKLYCVPALIKDNILVKGLPMTLGLDFFANATSPEDAPAVKLLREAGAVILGKANLAPMAMSAPDIPSLRGRVWNPYFLTDSASSSSSGNAAALAARLCVIGLASDTAGSTTAPATVTHVVGLRPPIGSFNMSGLFPIAGPSLDTIGLMALSVKDTCAMIDVLSHPNQTMDYDYWCGNGTLVEQPPIRVGVVGNLTYGEIALSRYENYSVEYEVLQPFLQFEANLRQLVNISVTVSWDDVVVPYITMVRERGNVFKCVAFHMTRFLEEHEMIATPAGERVRTAKDLQCLGFNHSGRQWPHENCSKMSDEAHCIFVDWRCILSYHNALNNSEECSGMHAPANAALRAVTNLLEESLFTKFDVVVFTQNSYDLLSLQDFSRSARIRDVGAVFAYPALVVPIGFTEPSWVRWNAIPVSTYFLTPPQKLHLMMNVAKRYEDVFWAPKMPTGFD